MRTDKEIVLYRRKFNNSLEPIKVMLVNRKTRLKSKQWLRFVERTKSSIILHPDQYLNGELPSQEMIASIVEKIFQDFISDQI